MLSCKLTNFSSSIFALIMPESSNTFTPLPENSVGSPGLPKAISSPKKPVHIRYVYKNETLLKILTINFRSIKNKKAEPEEIISSVLPEIILGTETWLNKEVSSSEFFSAHDYTV